jgi:outer membrane cobalamin receptor
MFKRVSFLLLLMAILLPGAGRAAEENRSDKDVIALDEIIVSATKTEESRKDVTNSVILIDEKYIEESGESSIGGLLANEQGIDLRTYGNYGGASEEIHIRGMGADGTQVLVNGVVINSPSLGTADVSNLSLNNIEKIEVVKGAGSLLYGTNAMAGIVNIITKRPEKDVKALSAGVEYGSNNTCDISAEQGMFISDSFGYYLTANKKETDGFRSNSGLDHKDISLDLLYEARRGLKVNLYTEYTDRSYGLPGVKTPDGTTDFYANGIKLYDSESSHLQDRGGDKNTQLALDVSGSPVDRLKLNLKASYLNMENYNKSVYYYLGLAGNKSWVTNRVKGIEGDAEIDLLKGMSVLLGSEYKKYDWEKKDISLDENLSEVSGTESKIDEGLNTFGVFAEGQYRPNSYVKLIAGLRRERHSEFGAKYISRYGAIINPFEKTSIKLNYGEHFKAPTLNDLLWPYDSYYMTSGNKNLKPETGKHYDAGIEQALLKDKLFLNADYFNWDINDKIEWILDSSWFYTPQNLNRYKCEGWELGAAIGPFFNTSLILSYTSSDATEKLYDGVERQARYTSDKFFKSDVKYANDNGLALTATFRYTGDRPGYYRLDTDTQPSVVLASYSTMDLNVEQHLFKSWILSVRCNNLFDEEYDTYTSKFTNQTTHESSMETYTGAGRSVFFAVSYRY